MAEFDPRSEALQAATGDDAGAVVSALVYIGDQIVRQNALLGIALSDEGSADDLVELANSVTGRLASR